MTQLYECPKCGELATAEEWEIVTQRDCKNRQERRRLYKFNVSRELCLKKKVSFKCPSCNEFIFRIYILDSKINDDEIIKNKRI